MAASAPLAGLPTGVSGRLLALGIALALLAVCWLSAVDPLLAWHAERTADLAQRRVLARRMAEVAATLPEVQLSAAAAVASEPGAAVLLDGTTDAIAAAALQERVQDMAAKAGAPISSLETLPVVATGSYRRVALRVSVVASWPVLVELLRSVELASPKMLVDDLQLRATPSLTRPANAPIESGFTVISFRRGDA